jgi:hypothetical protein
MHAVRDAGGLVLRVPQGDRWKLILVNGHRVPRYLIQQLIELQPYVMILLREICYDIN